jgi:hypothetical protein
MAHNKKKIILVAIISLAIMTTAATITKGKKYKNLKILPQDISEKKLDSIMDSYAKALKVSCDFCHVPPKKDMFSVTPATNETDFSLDNEMKENARRMMRMTIELNKKYFYFDSTAKPEYLNVVHCNTCHRGNPYPVNEQ